MFTLLKVSSSKNVNKLRQTVFNGDDVNRVSLLIAYKLFENSTYPSAFVTLRLRNNLTGKVFTRKILRRKLKQCYNNANSNFIHMIIST